MKKGWTHGKDIHNAQGKAIRHSLSAKGIKNKAVTMLHKTSKVPDVLKISAKEKETVPVIFRKWKSGKFKGDIDAIFPSDVANMNGDVTVYSHDSGHAAGSIYVMQSRTVPANPVEYADLKKELEMAGYDNLKIYKKDVKQFYEKRRKDLELLRKGRGCN